jgi:hypothetical protein
MTVAVVAWPTVCGSVSELPVKLASPAYVAVRVRDPAVLRASVQVPVATVPEQLLTPSPTVRSSY